MTKVVDAAALQSWITANQRDEAVVAPSPPPPPPPSGSMMPSGIPGNWALKFADDFDGTALDATKWNPNWLGAPTAITKPVNSAEIAAYDPAQVKVANSNLQLTAIRKTVTASNGLTYQYVSGLVESAGKFEFTYGAFEARVYMPGASATALPFNWGAVWLNGHHSSWPDHGENDVMENLSYGPAVHYHWKPSGGSDINKGFTAAVPAGGWSSSWHTFGCMWNASGADFYYDGVKVFHADVADASPKYIIANYAISTQHGGSLAVPQTMLVDYIRVWQAA